MPQTNSFISHLSGIFADSAKPLSQRETALSRVHDMLTHAAPVDFPNLDEFFEALSRVAANTRDDDNLRSHAMHEMRSATLFTNILGRAVEPETLKEKISDPKSFLTALMTVAEDKKEISRLRGAAAQNFTDAWGDLQSTGVFEMPADLAAVFPAILDDVKKVNPYLRDTVFPPAP